MKNNNVRIKEKDNHKCNYEFQKGLCNVIVVELLGNTESVIVAA